MLKEGLVRISVKTLAEFIHRRGDLYPPSGGRVTGEEGISTQRLAQQDRGSTYEREVPVEARFQWGDIKIVVSGRVDGCDLSASPPLVEEIKTTRAAATDAERFLGSAHWAQATLYAALLARTHTEVADWRLRLLYCHPDSHPDNHPDNQSFIPFDRDQTAEELGEFLDATIARYGRWLAEQQDYALERNRWLTERSFPYGQFRPHQRALAGRVYQAFKAAEHLLLEAPTGSGKTMGVLFPALKALADGHVARLFYLTSRGTGAISPLQAVRDLATDQAQIRVVDLIAKEKACLVPGMPCDESCPYAVGYFDRIFEAVRELLAAGTMDRDQTRAVAEAHSVCPFELSLDAALWADLIIGDYNYLLDPVVHLQRFSEDGRLGLLIDESHQLADRTRDMLSLTLQRAEVRAALQESPPALLTRRIKGLDRALMKLRRELIAELTPEKSPEKHHRSNQDDRETVIGQPTSLLRAMERTLESLAGETDLNQFPETRLLLFNLARWRRASAWAEPDSADDAARFRYIGKLPMQDRGVRNVSVVLACLDPARYLEQTLAGYGPHIRFSGTVSPLALYQSLHGQADAPAERVESPFAAEQLATLIVRDLPVYYRARTRTLPRLAALVSEICSLRAGNYLVALPSFDYLGALHNELTANPRNFDLIVQTPGMDEAARSAFLNSFQADNDTRLGLIVLGGVFAESVDFSHAPLAGVICVGVGIPPASILRLEMANHYQQTLGEGETVAYHQPAMTKVLQVAGRLLRSPTDRGVLCLVDDRFSRAEYQRFFPGHWRPQVVNADQVRSRLENFWQAGARLPRLRALTESRPETNPEAVQ